MRECPACRMIASLIRRSPSATECFSGRAAARKATPPFARSEMAERSSIRNPTRSRAATSAPMRRGRADLIDGDRATMACFSRILIRHRGPGIRTTSSVPFGRRSFPRAVGYDRRRAALHGTSRRHAYAAPTTGADNARHHSTRRHDGPRLQPMGALKCFKLGRRTLIRRVDAEAWLDRLQQPAQEPSQITAIRL